MVELLGAVLAAGCFVIVRPADFGRPEGGLLAMLTSEFLGTFILVLTVGLNVCASSPAAAFSIAASLMCMVYSLGDVSGANFNPAVTVAIMVARKSTDTVKSLLYMVVQIAGGLAA